VGGRFVDVEAGRTLPEGTGLTIEGGRIRSIDDRAPEGDAIDLGGRTVVPGLMNTHCHIHLVTPSLMLGWREWWRTITLRQRQVEKALSDCLERGITVIQDGLPEELDPNRRLAARIESGRLAGPRIHQTVHVTPMGGAFSPRRTPGGRLKRSMMGLTNIDYEDPDSGVLVFPPDAPPRAARDAVDRAIDERGATAIKFYDQQEWGITYAPGARVMTQEQLDAAADRARARGVNAIIHHLTVESFRRAVRAGVHSLVHVPLDALLEERDVRAFLDAGCTIEPTLTLAYFYSWDLEGHACHGHPRMRALDRVRRSTREAVARDSWIPELADAAVRGMQEAEQGRMRMTGFWEMSQVFRYFSAYATRGMDNVKLLWSLGARDRIACGSDAGAAWCSPAAIPLELDMLALCLNEDGEEAFTPADALRVATINSARAMALEHRSGSLEPGKVADLVVLDGDPLEDRSLLGRPAAAVWKAGTLEVDRCGIG
jgi:imidazolonepropionase-like amidohydrolase